MKKIVALVLSLVMALSLCTVAFAAYPTTGKYIYAAEGGVIAEDAAYCEVKFVTGKTNSDGSGIIDHYTVKVSDDCTNYFVPCDRDHADWAIFNGGAQVCWAKFVGENETGAAATHYDFKVTAQKATKDLPNCTTAQYLVDGYLDVNGNFWVEDDTAVAKVANCNGILVNVRAAVMGLNNEVIYASHIFAKGVANTKTGYDVATCLICKGEFACTNDNLVATKNGYKISTGFSYCEDEAWIVYNANAYDNGYDFNWGQQYAGCYDFCWQLKAGTTEEIGATTTTVDTNKGVESAKTFDAGIAMYVGMSLMSVAGTAVVIGKKKEF